MENVKSRKSLGQKVTPYAFLTPALISIFVFTLLPICYTVYLSFTNKSLNRLDNYKFIGFANFKDILVGPLSKIFLPVFLWTLIFALISTFGSFIMGLILALMLNNENMKESGVYKAILIIPWALPATIAVLSFKGLFNTQYGGINNLLVGIGMLRDPIPWLSDPFYARMAIIIVNIWLGFPYMMNVSVGALSAIDDVFYEAADIDGANNWTKFVKITLPSLAQTAYPLLISSFAFNFNNFNSAFLITAGGPPKPGNAYAGYTDILASSVYNMSLKLNLFGLGSALAIILFIVIGTISFIQMRASGQFEEV